MLIKLIVATHLRLFTLLSLLLFTVNNQAAEIPKLNAWVIDETQTLSKQQINKLSKKLARHEQKTSNQFVVLIIKTLGNETIENYTTRVFDNWQLGQADKENGLLLVIVKDTRSLRVKVGHDLTNKITKTMVNTTVKNDMAPLILKNNYYKAINNAVTKFITEASTKNTSIKKIMSNKPIFFTLICSFFTLTIPFLLYYLSSVFLKKKLSLRTCYSLYFIPAIGLSLVLLFFFGSTIKSVTVIFFYALTLTLSSYINTGILIFIAYQIKKYVNRKKGLY